MTRPIDPHHRPEQVDATAFVADNATLRGDVRIGAASSVWFGAVVRGDTETVEIGSRSNVQDLAVLHADPGLPCRLGDDVTVGHAAVVHGAVVESGTLIGIRAVVLNGARVGRGSIIAAGAVVTEGMVIPPDSLAMGIPARVVRPTTPEDRQRIARTAAHYVDAGQRYRNAASRPPSAGG